jgi:hypothetical protein
LPNEIQKQLFMYPKDCQVTLTQVEEAANQIHHQIARPKPLNKRKPQREQGKKNKGPKKDRGPKETLKQTKEGSPS